MKATELFEAFTGLLDSDDEAALLEPVKRWLIAKSDFYICDDDDDLRQQAIENTDLQDP